MFSFWGLGDRVFKAVFRPPSWDILRQVCRLQPFLNRFRHLKSCLDQFRLECLLFRASGWHLLGTSWTGLLKPLGIWTTQNHTRVYAANKMILMIVTVFLQRWAKHHNQEPEYFMTEAGTFINAPRSCCGTGCLAIKLARLQSCVSLLLVCEFGQFHWMTYQLYQWTCSW